MTAPHIVSVSSGLGSAFAWKLLCDQHGPDNVMGVFTDVNGEHPDNYRFLAEVQYALGSPLVKLANDGRTIWDVMIEHRFLANTRVDICSRVLKRESFQQWLAGHADPAESVVYLGIDWTEIHRLDRARPHWAKRGWTVRAPMYEPPYPDKFQAQEWLDAAGIRRPALYDMGFGHANCGGGCVKAGIRQFKRLLRVDRKWYVGWWEAGEEKVRRHLGKNVSILRERTKDLARPGVRCDCARARNDTGKRAAVLQLLPGPDEITADGGLFPAPTSCPRCRSTGWMIRPRAAGTRPLTLAELRERADADPTVFDDEPEEQGCGACFLEGQDQAA